MKITLDWLDWHTHSFLICLSCIFWFVRGLLTCFVFCIPSTVNCHGSFCHSCHHTATKISILYSFSGNCTVSVLIRVSVSDLYIPRIGPHIWLHSKIDRPILDINISKIHECRNWETEHYNSVLEIRRLHSFINGNT
jgi:hypothetical protein